MVSVPGATGRPRANQIAVVVSNHGDSLLNSCFCRTCSGDAGEGEGRLEQVPVDGQGEGPVLQLGQAPGDGQAQAAALGVRETSPRMNRSVNSSAEMFSGCAEIFLRESCTFGRSTFTST